MELINEEYGIKVDVEEVTESLTQYWNQRNEQFKEDREFLANERPIYRKNVDSVVLNDPKVMYDTSVALMSLIPPRFRLPLTINHDDDEKERISKSERFLLGIWRQLNDRHYSTGKGSWLREFAYWACSGWYAIQVLTRRWGSTVEFTADLFDPMTVYPEMDSHGLRRLVRYYAIDVQTAKAMAETWNVEWEPKDDKAEIKLINYWTRIFKNNEAVVFNAIMLGGKVIKPLEREKNFDRIPILCGAIGSPEKTTDNWKKRFGENIIASNRQMYELKNELTSYAKHLMKRIAEPDLISKSQSGRAVVKKEDIKGSGMIIPLRLGEELTPAQLAQIPAELNNLLGMADANIQRGGLPYIVHGGIPFEISGFAISQLMAAIRYKIGPYLTTAEHVIGDMMREFLHQYRTGTYPKVTLTTTRRDDMRKGNFYVEEFSKQDVPQTIHVEVKIPITSAMDRVQQMAFARQALSPPAVLSRETLWDEVFDVQDPDMEYSRIVKDETLEIPVVKQAMMVSQIMKLAQHARDTGDEAQAVALENIAAGIQPQPPGQQPGVPGVGPEALPPEASGQNPDEINAALRRGPTRPLEETIGRRVQS